MGSRGQPIIETTVSVSANVTLEARWDLPADPTSVAVFCHPHPLRGGTMTAPLMEKVTAVLVERGFGVLRFNFRGVGGSTGSWGEGIGEIDDIDAAVAAAASTYAGLPLGVAGWSFGAAASLSWQARERSSLNWVGIAPPVVGNDSPRLPPPDDLATAARTFIVGDRDQFVKVAELSGYASEIDAEIHVLRGSDHFFYFREDRVGAAVADGLGSVAID